LTEFRGCDDLNFGVSNFCKLDSKFDSKFDDKTIPDPQIWAEQIIDQFDTAQYDYNIMSNKREYSPKGGILNITSKEYDAFEDDIAVVSIFFEPSAIFLYGSKPSQTWLDFFSSIGGLLGLCIGFSIITVIELFWLCIQIISHLLQPINRNDQLLKKG